MPGALAAALRTAAGNGRPRRRPLAPRGARADRARVCLAPRLARASTAWRRFDRPRLELGLRTGTRGARSLYQRFESPLGRASAQSSDALVLVPDRSHD